MVCNNALLHHSGSFHFFNSQIAVNTKPRFGSDHEGATMLARSVLGSNWMINFRPLEGPRG